MMQLVINKTIEFDAHAERSGLSRRDAGARDRQLAILDAFAADDLRKAVELYDALPYNEDGEHPEQEFTGRWLVEIIHELSCNRSGESDRIRVVEAAAAHIVGMVGGSKTGRCLVTSWRRVDGRPIDWRHVNELCSVSGADIEKQLTRGHTHGRLHRHADDTHGVLDRPVVYEDGFIECEGCGNLNDR